MGFKETRTFNPHVNGKVVGFYRDTTMTLRHFVVLGVTKAMLKSWGNDVKAKWKETIFPTITDKEAKYVADAQLRPAHVDA
jgi:hypothetical protein